MLITSKWYNPEWKDYYCECGELFQLYIDGRCFKCREKDKAFQKVDNSEANRKFKEDYENRKNSKAAAEAPKKKPKTARKGFI